MAIDTAKAQALLNRAWDKARDLHAAGRVVDSIRLRTAADEAVGWFFAGNDEKAMAAIAQVAIMMMTFGCEDATNVIAQFGIEVRDATYAFDRYADAAATR